MAESLHTKITKIIQDALVEQDALTYHAQAGDTHTRAEAAAREIEQVIDSADAARKQREMLNPSRGIQINTDGGILRLRW